MMQPYALWLIKCRKSEQSNRKTLEIFLIRTCYAFEGIRSYMGWHGNLCARICGVKNGERKISNFICVHFSDCVLFSFFFFFPQLFSFNINLFNKLFLIRKNTQHSNFMSVFYISLSNQQRYNTTTIHILCDGLHAKFRSVLLFIDLFPSFSCCYLSISSESSLIDHRVLQLSLKRLPWV